MHPLPLLLPPPPALIRIYMYIKMCAEVRGQLAGFSSLSIFWVPGIKVRSSGLAVSIFIYSLNHLPGTYIYIF